MRIKSFLRMTIVAVGVLSLASCADMDEEQQRMVSGGAAGAVIGTVGTVITGGCIPCGTAIGGAVGVASGYIIEHLDKNTKSSSTTSNSTTGNNSSGGNSSSSGY